MKKISRADRESRSRLSKKRHKKQIKRRRLKKYVALLKGLVSAVRIATPRYFLLERSDTHFRLVNFLNILRRKLATGAGEILIDFTQTELIFPGGGLLFYAEIQRIKDLFPRIKFRCRESKSDRVNQVLQHLGIFQMLGHVSKVQPRRPDVVNWRHARSGIVDCTGAGQIIEAYASLSQPVTRLLYKAASEAVTNAVMHAYSAPRHDGLPSDDQKTWWMFCREEENRFYMAVCDLGVGIPETLTAKNAPEIINKILDTITLGAKPSDSQMILGAMEYARTRTQLPQQGKGLMDLRKIIEDRGAGKLYVFSNRGCVVFESDKGYQLMNFKKSIKGTMIVWSLPLVQQDKL